MHSDLFLIKQYAKIDLFLNRLTDWIMVPLCIVEMFLNARSSPFQFKFWNDTDLLIFILFLEGQRSPTFLQLCTWNIKYFSTHLDYCLNIFRGPVQILMVGLLGPC